CSRVNSGVSSVSTSTGCSALRPLPSTEIELQSSDDSGDLTIKLPTGPALGRLPTGDSAPGFALLSAPLSACGLDSCAGVDDAACPKLRTVKHKIDTKSLSPFTNERSQPSIQFSFPS